MDRPDPATPGAAVLSLWDQIIGLAARVEPGHWSAPTPLPGTDVRGLLAHLAGAHGDARLAAGSPGALADALRAARAARAAEVAAWTDPDRHRRLAGAWCLDLWVHGYDLATAVGQPVDLAEDSVAVAEASRYLLGHLPGLLALAPGPGRPAPSGSSCAAVVTAEPAALLLLLSGRGSPEHWRDLGVLDWSGPGAEAFVRAVRLPD